MSREDDRQATIRSVFLGELADHAPDERIHAENCGPLLDALVDAHERMVEQWERQGVLNEVAAELIRARSMFKPFNSAHEGYAVILEELDELWEEVKKKTGMKSRRRMRAEAIQVAAMGMRFVLDVCDKEEP